MNVSELLEPIEAESPCGPDLGYDDDFRDMEKAAEGQPERRMGESVIDAVPADWKTVQARALALLGRTKDLRVAVFLARSGVYLDGFSGLEAGLELLAGLVSRYWGEIHPKLDPDYGNDPTRRVNILTSLAAPDALDPLKKEVPLVSYRGRAYTLWDVHVARGTINVTPAEGETLPESSDIESSFATCDLAELEGGANAITKSLEHLSALNEALGQVLEPIQLPELEPLEKLLKEIDGLLQPHLEARRGAGEEAGEGAADDTPGAPAALPGRINSREEAVRMLDLVAEYFQRNEPSSPVPIAVYRAKRWIGKDFMELLKDVAPDGLPQAETIQGNEPEST